MWIGVPSPFGSKWYDGIIGSIQPHGIDPIIPSYHLLPKGEGNPIHTPWRIDWQEPLQKCYPTLIILQWIYQVVSLIDIWRLCKIVWDISFCGPFQVCQRLIPIFPKAWMPWLNKSLMCDCTVQWNVLEQLSFHICRTIIQLLEDVIPAAAAAAVSPKSPRLTHYPTANTLSNG